jgi:hypothetical protein
MRAEFGDTLLDAYASAHEPLAAPRQATDVVSAFYLTDPRGTGSIFNTGVGFPSRLSVTK